MLYDSKGLSTQVVTLLRQGLSMSRWRCKQRVTCKGKLRISYSVQVSFIRDQCVQILDSWQGLFNERIVIKNKHTAYFTMTLLIVFFYPLKASWTKISGYKFISGISVGSETTYHSDIAGARPLCQQRCDQFASCNAFRLYSFVGTVFCTLFETISDYSCPTDSTDWNCMFADGESWKKSDLRR